MAKFILSKSKLLEQYNKLRKTGKISYSVKTNPEIVKILEKETSCMFSVHSIELINKLIKIIRDKKRIWFFPQGWNQKEIEEIIKKGIRNFVVDNENDLNNLIEFLYSFSKVDKFDRVDKDDKVGNNLKINLLLRMKLKENTIFTGKYFVFGMYSEQINKLIPKLRKNKFIEKLGIHFHRKTQNVSEWSLKYEIKELLSEETLKAIDIINIGGGIPASYENTAKGISKILERIFKNIFEFKEWISLYNIDMIIEPGRFLSASPIILETEIKNIYDNNIVVDCSVYNSAMDTLLLPIKLLVKNEKRDEVNEKNVKNKGNKENKSNKSKYKNYTIKGCTPDSLDIFRYKVRLKEPKIGDKIIFLNAGAYNFTTDFCNLKKLKTEIVG